MIESCFKAIEGVFPIVRREIKEGEEDLSEREERLGRAVLKVWKRWGLVSRMQAVDSEVKRGRDHDWRPLR